MTNRTERTPDDWGAFDQSTMKALRQCDAAVLRRVFESGIQPAAASAGFHFAALLAREGIVASPIAWRRHTAEVFGLMIRDRQGRLWVGELAKVEGSPKGWLFSTTAGPFDPDLDGDQVHPEHLKYHSVEARAAA